MLENAPHSTSCNTCLSKKASLVCGICTESVCKHCAQFTDESTFSFLDSVPKELSHDTYCRGCFEQKVAPALAAYNETMGKAREVHVFLKNQAKESRQFKRNLDKPITISECEDESETVLRLAFKAVEQGYNMIIDVDLSSKTKVIDGSYHTTIWSASAFPVKVDPSKFKGGRVNRT